MLWHNEEKAQEARRWLRTQERPLVMGAAIGALAALAAAIVAALIGVWFK